MKTMGGADNWRQFLLLLCTDLGSIPGPSACQVHSYSFVQYTALSKYIWLITSSKTKRACANRYARLLDLVRLGSVRVIR